MALFTSNDQEEARDVDSNAWPAGLTPHKSLIPHVFWTNGVLLVSQAIRKNDPWLTNYKSRMNDRGIEYTLKRFEPDEFEKQTKEARKSVEEITHSVARERIKKILTDAIEAKANDVHIDIYPTHASVYFRVNNYMSPHQSLKHDEAKRIVQSVYNSMLEGSSGQTMYVREKNQDGQLEGEILPSELHGVRLNRGPTQQGECMVMRLHWSNSMELAGSFRERMVFLGYDEVNIIVLNYLRQLSKGMIVISGTTNSGKNTTMKHIQEASIEDYPGLQFTSVEDPVEMVIKGMRQIPVVRDGNDDNSAEKYNQTLLATLRRDPDRLMVSEIRDSVTMKHCVTSAQSGHQVMTTTHAGSPFEIIDRFVLLLRDMGDSDPLGTLRGVLKGLITQCLVPVLCECKKELTDEVYESLPETRQERLKAAFQKDFKGICLRNPKGCKKCQHTGVTGLTVVAETVPLDDDLFEAVIEGGTTAGHLKWMDRIKEWAKQAGEEDSFAYTLHGHARKKVRQGLVDPIEVTQTIGPLVMDHVMEDRKLEYDELLMWRPA